MRASERLRLSGAYTLNARPSCSAHALAVHSPATKVRIRLRLRGSCRQLTQCVAPSCDGASSHHIVCFV
eukprot:360870-Chlamydomonas_euryale.AAC.1